jgi:cytochrome c-type biogenesis protein CcmE
MSKKTLRVGISALVIVGALGFFLQRTLTEDMAYYKHVEEVMDAPEAWYGKKMHIHGWVVAGSIEGRVQTLDWRFQVKSGGKVVRAMYRGTVPDTFKDDSEVVLKGQLTPDGFQVEPGGVMAKCPSKYEANQPAAR